MKAIAKLHFHVTNQCTHYCRHCASEAGPRGTRGLTPGDGQYIIDWASDAGAEWVELSGGEPLTLGEDLFSLIEYAHAKGLYTSLLSNGALIDGPTVRRLREAGIGQVGVSLYGASLKTHDAFTRTPGSLVKTEQGIQQLTRGDIETIVNIVVTPFNLHELHDLPSRLEGVARYTFGAIVPTGRGGSLPEYSFTEDDGARAIRVIDRAFTGIPHSFMLSLHPSSLEDVTRYCRRPIDEVTINHEGQVIPCCAFPADLQERVGRARERKLKTIGPKTPVFHWLIRGHQRMREAFHGSLSKHNLCKNCITMLRALTRH